MLAARALRSTPRVVLVARSASTISASHAPSSSVAAPAPVSLSNIEASWKTLTPAEQESTFKALEELQKKPWTELSPDEKKASYYVAFGPHGPREPILPAGAGAKTFGGTIAAVLIAAGLFYTVRLFGTEKPRTVTKEWQEASNARAVEQKQDPFTGPSSPGYTGKGYAA